MVANENEEPLIIQDLRRYLFTSPDDSSLINNTSEDALHSKLGSSHLSTTSPQVALPVAAIKSLLGVIQRTKAETMMGLQKELKLASDAMLEFANSPANTLILGGRSHIALASGCELFMKYITRCFLELPDFKECMSQIISRGQRFSDISLAARDRIAIVGKAFIREGATVLTHGMSSVVSKLLIKAAQETHFSVIILEGRPDASGAKAAKELYSKAGIETTVVLDSAVGFVMENVDIVIVGAEGKFRRHECMPFFNLPHSTFLSRGTNAVHCDTGVVENGGIINKIGTYSLGIVAKEFGKPFYVAAESFKFARLYPLNQSDLPTLGEHMNNYLNFVDTASWLATGGLVGNDLSSVLPAAVDTVPGLVQLPQDVKVNNPLCDYTPAKYITLLFTDLGVLTPSAVSDELIRLYQ